MNGNTGRYNFGNNKPSIEPLPKPEICGIRTKPLCYMIAVILIAEAAFQMYAVEYLWKYDVKTEPHQYVSYAIAGPTILCCLCLIIGLWKQHSTTIAVFLWGFMEMEMLYMVYFSFMAITLRIAAWHYKTYYVIFCKFQTDFQYLKKVIVEISFFFQ